MALKAGRLSVLLLITVAAAALLQSSTAQTTHVVGDSLGWTIPPGGPVAYTTWAANQTFRVGDILVFNFNNGAHDVAAVTKADFDACNTSSPLFMISTSPANITLNTTGANYYICTFSGHCSAGQKLQINVSAAATPPAPAPQPATPSPVPAPQPSSPAPQPSSPSPAPSSPSPVSPSQPSSPSPSSVPSPPTTAPPPNTPNTPAPEGGVATPPAPAGNSATSLGVAGFSATFLSLVVAFFMC